jgi:hypothetical protein
MNSSGIPAQQALLDMCKMFGWSDTSRALTYYNPSAADIARLPDGQALPAGRQARRME